MTKLDTLSKEQAAWVRNCAYRCAYLIWPVFASIAILNAFNKNPSLEYLYWFVFAFVFAKAIHFFSQHSHKPNAYIQIELLVAAVIQGVLVGSLDLQVIPSLAILTPIIAFAFVGGALYLLMGVLCCFLGFVLYFFCIGISFYVVSDFDLNLVSIIAIILFQIAFTLVALVNYGTFETEQEEKDDEAFIDKATGLKTIHYFDSLIKNNNFEFLSKGRLNADENIYISLFLIRIDHLLQVSEARSQDDVNKQIAEFSYDLFYLVNSTDLLIRWQDDQLLLVSEKNPNLSTEKVAQSLVTSMHSHPIKGAELTPSIFCTDLCLIPSKTDKEEWDDKIKAMQDAMSNKTRASSWHFVAD